MSNFRAIATVTATLQRVLQAAVQADVPGAGVSTVRPGEGANTHLPTTGINLFLYQVSQNPHRSNLDLPARRPDGDLVQRPQMALDLHYLLSFYGDDLALEPQRLLGSAVAFLHSQPLITRTQIEAAIADSSKPFLANSDLAEQPELVRFTPITISLEELSRLWSVLLQVHYVLSVAYKASVVLVERPVTTRPSLPTRMLNLAAVPLRSPRIHRVVAQAGEDVPITSGSAIQVEGTDLQGAATTVEIDGVPASLSAVEPGRLTVALPATLAAGPHSIQVRQGVEIGGPGITRPAFASNLGAFAIRPAIRQAAGSYDIVISNVQGTGAAPRSATVAVGVTPAIAPRQTATLELLAGQQIAGTFLAQPRTAAATSLTFLLTGVAAGDYLFRLRVDGAESPLDRDAGGTPIAPKGTIP